MTRNPTTAHLSLIKELQTLLNKGSEMNGYPGGVMLSYSGTLSEKTSNSLIALTENAVCQCGVLRAELLRTKSVVTDCLKSFSRYGWIDEKGEIEIYLILDCAENGIHVKCGGFFKNDTSIELAEKIDSINEMSISDLRKESVELLCKSEDIGNNNADLCLVNTALNCNRPISYNLDQNQEDISLLKIDLIINHANS